MVCMDPELDGLYLLSVQASEFIVSHRIILVESEPRIHKRG